MVERLFTGDANTSNVNNCQCNVTNLINESGSFYATLDCNLLPTINENSEGFQSTATDETLLRTRSRIRSRRNSHPSSFSECQTLSNVAFTTNRPSRLPAALKCKQGQTKCRKCSSRDPMLSFKILPKDDSVVFDKHKLDKIDEGDSMTELGEENDAECEAEKPERTIDDISRYSKTGRRSSYPRVRDSTAFLGKNLVEPIRDFNRQDIVSRWMKFF